MADKRISQLAERVDIANNDVVAIVASGATVTNKATISSIQAFMQGALDVGVTSVGVTISETDGQPISVTGSPITTSGNITINLPRATNSIRGVLDAEDFINFSNKQGTITLTTSGTSGASTFDGATLNIPNYAQDLTGFVTLGTAQTITGEKTFTNDVVLKNSSLAGLILSSFSPNVLEIVATISGNTHVSSIAFPAGNQSFTLPNASGTIALTSNIPSITGLVTLDTVQTITAQKTITTNGNSDTLIVNHTSGSGIALDIAKTGNGEGLRVVKTSGSGNAVTITGGLLSAEAATLTNALNGTSAVFSQGINVTGNGGFFNSANKFGLDQNGITSRFYANGSNTSTRGQFEFHINSSDGSLDTTALGIASTGAATFSSSVTAARNNISTGTSTAAEINFSNTANNWSIKTGTTSNTFGIFENQFGGIPLFISGGNVGIGTATPDSLLHVNNTINTAYDSTNTLISGQTMRVSNLSTTSGISANLLFIAQGAGGGNGLGSISGVNTGTGSLALTFGTRDSGGSVTERMRITSTGNVGIGTSSPNFKTHISTGSTSSITQPTAGSFGLYIQQNTSGSVGGLYIQDGASNSGAQIFVADNNGAARFVVDGDGNVLIGTTTDTGARLFVNGGDIGIQQGHGLRLVAPNGVQYRVTVNNSGTLITTQI